MGALMCGLLSGLGFTVIENWFTTNAFVASQGGPLAEILTSMMLQRGIIGAPWAHLVFTAVASVGVWYLVSQSPRSGAQRLAVAIAFFLLAAALHGYHDAALQIGLAAVLVSWVGELAVLIALIVWARRAERRWFSSRTDRLFTDAGAVQRPPA